MRAAGLKWVIGFSVSLIASVQAHAQPLVARTQSIESTVANSDLVFIATLVNFRRAEQSNDRDGHEATIAIEETLKQEPFNDEPYRGLSLHIPRPASVLADWKERSSRLLVAYVEYAPEQTAVIELAPKCVPETMTRLNVTFRCTVPFDASARPPGEEVAKYLSQRFNDADVPITKIDNYEDFAWSFQPNFQVQAVCRADVRSVVGKARLIVRHRIVRRQCTWQHDPATSSRPGTSKDRNPTRKRGRISLSATQMLAHDYFRIRDDSIPTRRTMLSFVHVLNRCCDVILVPQPTNASAFGPPIVTLRVELIFETPGCPRFQIRANFLRRSIGCGYNHMHVIRSTIDRMKMPASMTTCVADLVFHRDSLLVG